ncbi:hypothetical protein [Treponema sp. R6D11]
MKLIKKLLAIFAIIAAIGFMILPLTGCPEVPTDDETKKIPKVDPTEEESGEDPLDYIQLTEGVWKNGNIPISDGEQWFRFTATAATQYIHFDPGTMSMVYVQLYDDSKENKVGSQASLYSSSLYISRTVTSGSVYYIKVTPYNSNNSGNYQIMFTTSSTLPITLPTTNVTTLTSNIWGSGNITTPGGEQWFTFTANATTQYIHFSIGTLNDVNIQLYDSTGVTVGTKINLWSSTLYTSQTVTSGSVYYIKVTPYDSIKSGNYQIAFNTSSTKPQ